MRIALAQIAPVLGDLDINFRRTSEILAEARTRGADLVIFPELSLTGYSLGQDADEVAIEVRDERLSRLASEAEDTSVIVGFHEDGDGLRTYNSTAYFERGALAHLHRKLYLPTYGIFEERKHFSPGQSMRAFGTRHGRMAMLICNDAWQPALGFLAIQDGAQTLFIPSNSANSRFPDHLDTPDYWRDITRFYARMFECYVIFVNRVGTEDDLTFWGGSHIVDPLGDVVAEAAEHEEAVVTADIDLNSVRRRRRKVPLVKEARLALLGKELSRLADEGGDL
jgi:predicted amidohydrolase